MTHVTCKLTANNRNQLRNPIRSVIEYGLPVPAVCSVQPNARWPPVRRNQVAGSGGSTVPGVVVAAASPTQLHAGLDVSRRDRARRRQLLSTSVLVGRRAVVLDDRSTYALGTMPCASLWQVASYCAFFFVSMGVRT